MHLQKLVTTAVLALSISAQAGELLVSPAEVKASEDAPPAFNPKIAPVPGAPTIEVMSPTLAGPIPSPTPIQLKFLARAPATVKPDTFKVQYGAFQIDITKRLLSVATVNEDGVSVKEAALPKGKHKLHLFVEDTAGRSANRVLEFEVN